MGVNDALPKTYKNFVLWANEADIPFDFLDENHKDFLRYLFSFMTDNNARKLAQYSKDWGAFDAVFWDNSSNNLYYLDARVNELVTKFRSSVVIVFTGISGATGVSKSWSAISLSNRYANIHDGYFALETILMNEADLPKLKNLLFKRTFSTLDDPSYNDTGAGVSRLKTMLKKFTRQLSRKSQTSLFPCSAIDIFTNRSLRLDGVHFFIEMWGYNIQLQKSLGMLYDNDLSPIGWVFIPSPITREIKYYDAPNKLYQTLTLKDISIGKEYNEQTGAMVDILVDLETFIYDYYEDGLKKDFIEKQASEGDTALWTQYIDVVELDESFQNYCDSKTNLETLVARILPSLTGDERKYIVNEVYIRRQTREVTESITSITGKYFIDSETFDFNLTQCLDDMALSSKWNREVDAYRLNRLNGMSQDDIVQHFKETLGVNVSQMTISNYVNKVDGELSRVMGKNYEDFLTDRYSKIEGVETVEHNGQHGQPDLVVTYEDGQIDVISIKCYAYKRSSLTIPISELEAEIRHIRRLQNQGKENLFLILEFYNHFTKERIRKTIAHNVMDSLPAKVSLKLKTD